MFTSFYINVCEHLFFDCFWDANLSHTTIYMHIYIYIPASDVKQTPTGNTLNVPQGSITNGKSSTCTNIPVAAMTLRSV